MYPKAKRHTSKDDSHALLMHLVHLSLQVEVSVPPHLFVLRQLALDALLIRHQDLLQL